MTSEETFEFIKTGQGAATGALMGAGAGIGLQAMRLKGKNTSVRQQRLALDIAKQRLEVRDNPSSGNVRKLKILQLQHRVATFLKQRPGLALAGSGLAGAAVGGFTGKNIGQL